MDSNDKVIVSHLRRGNVSHLEHIRIAKLFKSDRLHYLSSRLFSGDAANVACAIAEAVIAAGNPT
ncbi:hypothetical protein D3C75_1351370 [compost metagenome]